MLLLRPATERHEQRAEASVGKFVGVVVGVGIGDDEEGEGLGSGGNHPEELGRSVHGLGEDVLQSWRSSSQVRPLHRKWSYTDFNKFPIPQKRSSGSLKPIYQNPIYHNFMNHEAFHYREVSLIP